MLRWVKRVGIRALLAAVRAKVEGLFSEVVVEGLRSPEVPTCELLVACTTDK
jgi:hypothetical protein